MKYISESGTYYSFRNVFFRIRFLRFVPEKTFQNYDELNKGFFFLHPYVFLPEPPQFCKSQN